MPFHYVLTNLLVDVPDALGAIFLDDEGEAVEWVSNHDGPPYHLKVEGAYHAVIKRRLAEITQSQGAGALQSYAFVGSQLATLTEVAAPRLLCTARGAPLGSLWGSRGITCDAPRR